MNLYTMFGDSEEIEPNTVFGPNDTKASGLLGDVAVILYEVAPGNVVHLRITVLEVAENTDTVKSNEGREKNHHNTF